MEGKEDFTVHDRRKADAEGAHEQPAESRSEQAGGTSAAGADRGPGQEPLPEVDFATFILSLATSAQISLGAVPHPETNETGTDIAAAKQMIDIIGILQEKTRGNLSTDESKLLEQVLHTLRLHLVRRSQEIE